MTADFAMRLASAAAQVLAPDGGTVLIGKDTRLSGYMFESALEAGFVAAGADVLLLGPLPTPGIAYLTQQLQANIGVVISASHNLYHDNGIKIFDAGGNKLTDSQEAAIEGYLGQSAITLESHKLGRAKRIDSAQVRYQEFCKSTFPGLHLSGVKLVSTARNGAAYKVAPRTLARSRRRDHSHRLLTERPQHQPGLRIHRAGAAAPPCAAVGAHVGIALDGDGDRVRAGGRAPASLWTAISCCTCWRAFRRAMSCEDPWSGR
jgi:phosphoglucosamine mutase